MEEHRPGVDVVKLASRPNTTGPDGEEEVVVSAETIRNMTDEQLVWWCNNTLGMSVHPSATRNQVLTRLAAYVKEVR